MVRRNRTDRPGAWHHLMNRGAKRESIFLDDEDRYFFLKLLSSLDEKFEVEIHAYCLMGNHYHLLAHSRQPQLSEAMQWLGLRYAKRFNWRHGFDGSPFRGRFHQVVVASDEHLVAVGRYIHRNPLDLGIERLASYRWSSMANYLGGRRHQTWVHVDVVRRLSSGTSTYEQFVQAENDRSDLLIRQDGVVEADLRGLQLVTPVDRPQLLDLDQLIEMALADFDGSVVVHRSAKRSMQSRRLSLILGADMYRYSAADLAQHHGLANAASARAALSKARAALAADPVAQQFIERFRQK